MGYYNYHATVRRLLGEGKLLAWYIAPRHGRIAPALVLVFDDIRHPKMPLREYRWEEYLPDLPPEKRVCFEEISPQTGIKEVVQNEQEGK